VRGPGGPVLLTIQLRWGAHAPSRAVVGPLANHTGPFRTSQRLLIELRFHSDRRGAGQNTRLRRRSGFVVAKARGRVFSPFPTTYLWLDFSSTQSRTAYFCGPQHPVG